jgi:hypothetical protein
MKQIIFLCLFLQSIALSQTGIPSWQKTLQNAKHDTTRLKCYAQLGYFYTYINTDSAAFYLKKGEAIAVNYPTHPNTFSFLNSMGSYFATIREQEKAVLNYEKAKALAYTIYTLDNSLPIPVDYWVNRDSLNSNLLYKIN